MFQCKDLQNFVIALLFFAQAIARTSSFQNTVYHTSGPYNPYIPLKSPFVQRNSPGSSWQFGNIAGVPTWIITTTSIETRNEASNATWTKDDDSPVGPNLREDAMMAANDNEDPDLEFPIRHGKDPAVHARPAFGDPDMYEETTSGPNLERNETKPIVTVNRTTVVKIEFHNTPFLPLVLNVGNTVAGKEDKNSSTTREPTQQTYSATSDTQKPSEHSSNPSATRLQFENSQSPTQTGRIDDRVESSAGFGSYVAPKHVVPEVQYPSVVPYDGALVPPLTAQFPQSGVIYPYARFWRKK